MSANVLNFQQPEKRELITLPGPRIWKPEDLANFFGYKVGWVYKITMQGSEDPPPRCRMRAVRFDTYNPEFVKWVMRKLGYDVE